MLPRERKTAELPTDTVPPTLLASVDEVVRVTSHAVILGCCDTRPMSALGQSRHFDRASFTSGLPRLADIPRSVGMSQRCQTRTLAGGLFNNGIGAQHQPSRYVVTDRFRGLEIDGQLEFRRLLNR
jgi:hypothetical protein